MHSENQLNDIRCKALQFEQQINEVVIGQEPAIRNLLLAVFARGHVLLEGQVGIGKTTLLRAATQGLGGRFQRIEGTIDLMPADLIYYTYLDASGKPNVDPGPLIKQGEHLSVFFFNEINRARPQVHSLMLRVMAERCVSAFNREFRVPHVLVFADRNRIEREETFELPAAARDRFMMEIGITASDDEKILGELMFNPRYHDADTLVSNVDSGILPYAELNDIAFSIQQNVQTSSALRDYALSLWKASAQPKHYGIMLSDVDMEQLIRSGPSPRGMSFFIRAAKVRAWLENRTMLLPEDMQAVFSTIVAHRIFLNPIYEYRKEQLIPTLIQNILNGIAAP